MPADSDILLAIRALIPDQDAIFGDTGDQYLISDDAINAIYDTAGHQSVLRTAAWACNTIANNTLIVGGDIQNDEIATNSSRTAAEWRNAAKLLFARADSDEPLDEAFDIVPLRDHHWPKLSPRPFWTGW